MKSVHRNVPLVAIGYRYSTRTTLFFVATKDSGSTTKGNPYEMKYTDDWGNVRIRYVDRPEIISNFFECSNMIDRHNQVRQFELALEKRWLTQNPLFCLHTTIVGINVVDCYMLADYHDIINRRIPNKDYKMTMTQFASILANQLIKNVNRLLSFYSPLSQEVMQLETIAPSNITVSNASQESSTSTLTTENLPISLRSLTDANGKDHHQIAYEVKTGSTGKRRTKTRVCSLCFQQDGTKGLVDFVCFTCGIPLCCLNKYNNNRDCIERHVQYVCRYSDRQV